MMFPRRKRLIGAFLVLVAVFFSSFFAVPPQALAAKEVKPGILIIAHGTKDPTWTTPVWEAAYELKDSLPYPVALGFLEEIKPDIPEAVQQLNTAGVNKIIAVPLFLSSYSNHIEEIKYILGLRRDVPGKEHQQGHLERARPLGKVVLTPAIDDHPLLAEVLTAQIGLLIQNGKSEVGVLAAHGSDSQEGQVEWVKSLSSLGRQIQQRLVNKGRPLKGIRHGFLFEGLIPSVREAVYEGVYTDKATALVVPVMISEGHFTGRKIPEILREFPNHTYRYPEKGQRALISFKKSYANRIVEWRMANELWPRPKVIKDGLTTELTLDRCQEIAQDSGKGYPDSVLAFRLAGVALPALWPDRAVVADELMVVSFLPPEDGSKPVFDYLAGTADVKYLGSSKKITSLSPTFIFANKATGETVFIHLRPSVLGGEDFFDLYSKVVNGQASEEEEAALQVRQDLLLRNLLTRPAETIFDWKKISPLAVYSPDGAILKFSYADLAVEENKLCVCGSFAFRLLGEAFAILYGERLPQQARFEVASGWTTEGIKNALRLVAGEGNYALQGEEPFKEDNYYLAVTDKAISQTAVVVKAKPQLFPEEFFALRNKVKQGTATPDEKARFQELRRQVIWSLLFKPADEIFSVHFNDMFKDMQGHWAAGTVGRLASRGIVYGYHDGTFKPENGISRAEAATMLARALKLTPSKEEDLKFTDSAAIPVWARESVAAVAKEGLVLGHLQLDGTVTFEPDREISRMEMIVLVQRILEKKIASVTPRELGFADADTIPDSARESVGAAAAKGVIVGYPDNTFQAHKPITRAEAATMVLRLLDALGNR
ncbi:MAG: S-layer homology domain-containing protein [Moorellaceae bacterium]